MRYMVRHIPRGATYESLEEWYSGPTRDYQAYAQPTS